MYHKVAFWPQVRPELAKKVQNHPQNVRFCSVRRPDRCYIGKSPIAKVSGLIWPKKSKDTLKMSRSALTGVPPGVTLATSHSIFIKWPSEKLFGLKRGLLHHKVAPPSQKRPELAKKVQNHPRNVCHVPLCWATWQVLHRQPTTLFSINKSK